MNGIAAVRPAGTLMPSVVDRPAAVTVRRGDDPVMRRVAAVGDAHGAWRHAAGRAGVEPALDFDRHTAGGIGRDQESLSCRAEDEARSPARSASTGSCIAISTEIARRESSP